MYIENKYWDHYIGDTDDSLTLIEYLAYKRKNSSAKEIPVKEIFADMGLEQLRGDFRQADSLLVTLDGMEMEIYYVIDLVADLAAILLECKVNGSVKLSELCGNAAYVQEVCIVAEPQEHEQINQILKDFAADPLAYNLSEMVPEEEMLEMAGICEDLRKELYE